MTLKEATPFEFAEQFQSSKAYKFCDVTVVKEYSATKEDTWRQWPGKEKNVYCWWVLENGKAVGWNENPARGWSFPVVSYKETN